MPQKKKKANKKSHKKSHNKHINQTIIQQTLPNYSSGQMSGHQYNKDHVQFAPQTQQSHTDNIVGELVGRLMNKIENDNNKEVQQYSKEIQPMNNNTQTVNIYNKDATITEEKKSETPSSQTSQTSQSTADAISDGIRNVTRSAGEDFLIGAASGVASIGTAAFGAAGWRNRKAIRNSISNFSTNARSSLSSVRERFRNPSSYQPHVDVVSPAPSIAGSRRPSNASIASTASSASNQARNVTDPYHTAQGITPAVRRPSSASSRDSNFISQLSETVGITPARPRISSDSSNYGSRPQNLIEQFDNTTPTRPSTRRAPALNTEERNFLQRTLRQQGLDTEHLSPVNTQILRGRPSGIQEHTGVSTRNIRAETGEAHASLSTRGRGRPRTVPYGPVQQPNPVGRPRTNEYARPIGPNRPRGRPPRAQEATPTRAAVTRNITKTGNKK